jgi:lipopolysaccharide export system protein LptC
MAAWDNAYSRLVFWLKIVLPLLALAILSTIFLLSRTIDPTRNIRYADVDVEDLANSQRIGAPAFSGVTEDGAAIEITSRTVRPEDASMNRMLADEPAARLTLPKGQWLAFQADTGWFDIKANTLGLDGRVRIITSQGYNIHMQSVLARLDATSLIATGGIKAEAPMGSIEAGELSLAGPPNDRNDYVLVFKGAVKLVYDPAR